MIEELELEVQDERSKSMFISDDPPNTSTHFISTKLRFDTDFFSKKVFGKHQKGAIIEEIKNQAGINRKSFVDHNQIMSAIQP